MGRIRGETQLKVKRKTLQCISGKNGRKSDAGRPGMREREGQIQSRFMMASTADKKKLNKGEKEVIIHRRKR